MILNNCVSERTSSKFIKKKKLFCDVILVGGRYKRLCINEYILR